MPKQINKNLKEVEAKDEIYTPSQIDNLITQALESEKISNNFVFTNLQSLRGKVKVDYQGKELYFVTKNFNWAGKKANNKGNKKRIQTGKLKKEEIELFYRQQLFLLGIYHFQEVLVAGYYEIKEKKKIINENNSSRMWITSEELKETLSKGCYQKSDELGTIHLFSDLENLFYRLLSEIVDKNLPKEPFPHISLPTKPTLGMFPQFVYHPLTIQEFINEDEIQSIFEKNLSKIFPNLTFLKHKWSIPYWEGEREIIDTLAFHHYQEDRWENVVLFEHKWTSKIECPLTQIGGYYETLKNNDGNFGALKDIFNDYLVSKGKERVDWKQGKKHSKEFWDKNILICTAPFGYFEPRQKKKASKDGTILIEIQKYKNFKGEIFVLVSLFEEKYQEILGMTAKNVIIQKE